MDHKTCIAALAPAERRRLTVRSNQAGLGRLAGHLGAILAVALAIGLRVPGWPLLLLPQGVLLMFLFMPLHETTHDTPFRSLWLNRAVGWLCGAVLVLPPRWFHYFHMAHHRWTQIPGKDPELASPPPRSRAAYLWHLTGLPVWRGGITTLLINAAGRNRDSFVPDRRRAAITLEARLLLALYLLVLTTLLWSPLALWIWIVPSVLGQPVLRLYLMAEHGRCAFAANMLENSRTTLTNRLVRWLAWNMPYHAEHHSYPAVPFHRLPDLHRHLAPYLVVKTPGYRRFHREYAATLER